MNKLAEELVIKSNSVRHQHSRLLLDLNIMQLFSFPEYNPAILLKARDNRGKPLLDVLIENEQVNY